MILSGRTIRQFSTEAGSIAETDHRSAIPPHAHPQVTFCLITRGELQESIHGTTSQHSANDLIFRNAGEAHADAFGPDGARCFNVMVDPALLQRASQTWRLDSSAAIVRRLRRELRGDTSAMVVEGLLYQLVGELCRDVTPRKNVAEKASDVIRERFAHNVSARAIAEEIGVHPVHLMRAFRATYGIPLVDAVRELRIGHAKGLLRGTTPIAEIALASGFADQSHFTKVFRRATGTTPRRYRLGKL